MSQNTFRGMRLGSQSLESTVGVTFEPRSKYSYQCPAGHLTELAFAADAEVPNNWECKACSKDALLLRNGETVEPLDFSEKTPRSHWEMLLERRSIEELEDILQERLDVIRARREQLSGH
ncbi:MAG: RNA polymerase-binding protein RbpA [Micrococcales bacterium]